MISLLISSGKIYSLFSLIFRVNKYKSNILILCKYCKNMAVTLALPPFLIQWTYIAILSLFLLWIWLWKVKLIFFWISKYFSLKLKLEYWYKLLYFEIENIINKNIYILINDKIIIKSEFNKNIFCLFFSKNIFIFLKKENLIF